MLGYLALVVVFYAIGKFHKARSIRKFLKATEAEYEEECVHCDEEHKNCTLQLSMVLPSGDTEVFDRVEPILQTSLNDNFAYLNGELHRISEENHVITYSTKGEGAKNGLSLFKEINTIVKQEHIPYHLIVVKRLGTPSNPWGYATLNEVNRLGDWNSSVTASSSVDGQEPPVDPSL